MRLRFSLLLLPLLAAGLGPAAQAQTASLVGEIVDADSDRPLPTATVALLVADSLITGATADFDGAFRVQAPPGTYDVRVTFVGYDPLRQSGVTLGNGETDLGQIRLTPSAEALAEVSVAAERPQRQSRIDRTVYDTADDPVAEGGNATDVLSTIPSVDVDVDGNISLRGSGNVAVFINGRPAPVSSEFVASYLASLPSGSIDRVEVIPNPSAAFEPDGVGGILNIVLKQDAEPGLGGTLTAGADVLGGVDLSTALTYGRGPWSLAATYGFRHDVRDGSGTNLRENSGEVISTLFQDETEDRTRTSHLLNVSADYAASRATTLSSSVQVGTRGGDETEVNTATQTFDTDPDVTYKRVAEEVGDGLSGDVRLGLRHTFGDDHRLSIEGRAEASEEEETQSYLESLVAGTGELDAPQRVAEDGSEREYSFQVDYTRPVAGLTLDLGYLGEIEREESTLFSEVLDAETGEYVPEVGVNNEFSYEQVVHALYAQAAGEWGPWGLQTGLRMEGARTTFDLFTTDESFENDYRSLFPSAFLSFSPTDLITLRGGYSRRINRPRTRSLNPFPSFDDPFNIRQGNPALRPEYVDAVELSANVLTGFGSVSVTPYYRHTTDVIRRISVLREDGVIVRTSQNLDASDAYGAEAVVTYEGGPLRGYVSFEGYRLQTEGETTETSLSNDAFGWGGRLNASYGLGDRFGWGNLDLQATARYSAPINTEQGRVGARTFVDLALRQKLFDDKASLTLKARDPLGLAGFSYVLDQPGLRQEFERDWGAQQVGLTFAYTFGQESGSRDRDRQRGEGGSDFEGEEY